MDFLCGCRDPIGDSTHSPDRSKSENRFGTLPQKVHRSLISYRLLFKSALGMLRRPDRTPLLSVHRTP